MKATFCCDERRREAVRGSHLNGIDYLEVEDGEDAVPADRQRLLSLYMVKPETPPLGGLTVRIAGATGASLRDARRDEARPVRVVSVREVVPGWLHVEVEQPGDYSTYTLTLEAPGLDPVLSSIDFSFKVECAAACPAAPCAEPAASPPAPIIDYMARDYDGVRRLMLDRLALLLPGWSERSPADLGVTLVELLAQVADQLSYQQDAIATEAYLETARRRVSARRHARLVDYRMHDGSNARTWVQVRVSGQAVAQHYPADWPLAFTTRIDGVPARLDDAALATLDRRGVGFETFEPLRSPREPAVCFDAALDEIELYSWGNQRCTLPRGATAATLRGDLTARQRGGEVVPLLQPGHVLLLEELLDPGSGRAVDADPAHRHVVRLTDVRRSEDPIGQVFEGGSGAIAVTEVTWAAEDALPFSLCISALDGDGQPLRRVSVARGNLLLADHGRSARGAEALGAPPLSARFRPRLARGPVTQAAPYLPSVPGGPREPVRFGAAAAAMRWSLDSTVPVVAVSDGKRTWRPRRDLLGSDAAALDMVVEVEDDGGAAIRFGDDDSGLRPAAGVALSARYRVGNGSAGNVPAEAIAHVVTDADWIVGVRNPLAARGGVDPESIAEVRRHAPQAFRVLKRAVTPADYAEVTERHPEVQRAVATLRWTGSWRTVFIAVDRRGGRPIDEGFAAELRGHLERYRMAVHDVEIDGPRFVALELALHVCVEAGYFRRQVEQALLDVLSAGTRRGGGRGAFHPDNFSFGQPVYLAPLVALAQSVEGVRFVEVAGFQRRGVPDGDGLAQGVLPMGRLEIARLDNDPSFRDRGVLSLALEGGR